MKSINTYQGVGVIIFIVALFVQTFYNDIIWIDYVLDTNSYAALCINKDKPEMECNGHCQMAKKMQGADEKNQQTPQIQFVSFDVVLFIQDGFHLNPPVISPHKNFQPDQESVLESGFRDATLRPPIQA